MDNINIKSMIKNVNELIKYFNRDTAVDFNVTNSNYDEQHTAYIISINIYGHKMDIIYVFDENVVYLYDRTLDRNILKCNGSDPSNIDMLFDCGVRNYILILHNSNLLYNGNSYDVL